MDVLKIVAGLAVHCPLHQSLVLTRHSWEMATTLCVRTAVCHNVTNFEAETHTELKITPIDKAH